METRAPTHEDYLAAGRGELSAEEFKAALPHATAAVRDLIFPNEPDGSEEWARGHGGLRGRRRIRMLGRHHGGRRLYRRLVLVEPRY